MQERLSLIFIIVLGEDFAQFNGAWKEFNNLHVAPGMRTAVGSMGTLIFYVLFWLFFDNANLSVADNKQYQKLLSWLHVNLCTVGALAMFAASFNIAMVDSIDQHTGYVNLASTMSRVISGAVLGSFGLLSLLQDLSRFINILPVLTHKSARNAAKHRVPRQVLYAVHILVDLGFMITPLVTELSNGAVFGLLMAASFFRVGFDVGLHKYMRDQIQASDNSESVVKETEISLVARDSLSGTYDSGVPVSLNAGVDGSSPQPVTSQAEHEVTPGDDHHEEVHGDGHGGGEHHQHDEQHPHFLGETRLWRTPRLTRNFPPMVQEHKKALGYDLLFDLFFVAGIGNLTHLLIHTLEHWAPHDSGVTNASLHHHRMLSYDDAGHHNASTHGHHNATTHGCEGFSHDAEGLWGMECNITVVLVFSVLSWLMMELWFLELTYQVGGRGEGIDGETGTGFGEQ